MATIANLLVKLGLDSADYSSGLDAAERQAQTKAKNIGDALGKIGSQMSGVGKKMSLGMTAPIVGGFALAINSASDMSETVSKSNVVFGDMATQVQTFANSASTNLGMSSQQALEAASTYGNLFISMGTGSGQAADMSTVLVQLAADLASFNNLDPTEVLEKLRSGMVGETEPLRSLGVNISAAAVQQKALEMGMADSSGELSNSAMLAARYALIMEQTTTAQGDFARTSDGLANSTRSMKSQLGDAAVKIGTLLLPIAQKLVNVISQVITWFTNLSPTTQRVIVIILAVVAAIGPLLMIVGSLISAIGAIVGVVSGPLLAALAPVILVIGIIIGVIALLAAAWNNNWFGIRDTLTNIWNNILNQLLRRLWSGFR